MDLVFLVSAISSTMTNEAHVVSYLAIWQATFHHRKRLSLVVLCIYNRPRSKNLPCKTGLEFSGCYIQEYTTIVSEHSSDFQLLGFAYLCMCGLLGFFFLLVFLGVLWCVFLVFCVVCFFFLTRNQVVSLYLPKYPNLNVSPFHLAFKKIE